MEEDDPVCPVCYTGVLQPTGDMGGHLVCSVCFAQSQDVVLEEVDNFISGEDVSYLRRAAPAAARKEVEVNVIDSQAEVMVYLKCLQRLLQAQEKVIRKWFACVAYEGVLKQIWKLTCLQCGLLDVGHLKMLAPSVDIGDGDTEPDASDDEPPRKRARGRPRKGDITGNAYNSAKIVFMCNKTFSMSTTLACHLLTAWALKLPLWARDLQHAAREGDLPYRDAINLCEDLLEGHPFARRALRSFSLCNSESGLVATAQHVAAAINMVVPELNLGAFVHRHCASLGLPQEVATLATHLALSRQVNTREYGIPSRRGKGEWACAQRLQVFLPILAVCKHVLQVASMFEDGVGHDFNATAAKPWIQAGQRLLELRELDAQQRHHMVMAESIDNVLDFIELDTLYDCRVPSSLARAQQSLQGYAGEIEQQGDAADEQDAQMSGLCGDVVAETDNAADVASQMYLQLHRLIAVETGLEITQLDVVALHYFRDLSHE